MLFPFTEGKFEDIISVLERRKYEFLFRKIKIYITELQNIGYSTSSIKNERLIEILNTCYHFLLC